MASEVVTSESVARRYRIQRPLGEGTTKRVYLARDTVLDRDVALSILKTDGLDGAGLARLRTEAQAIARLGTHPHVVTVFDLGDAAGGLYLSTEFVAGGELQRRLDAAPEHRLPLDEALRLADEICQALAHAHAADLVHRDLNPGNVWLTAEGAAKVGDFGLAVSIARSRAVREGRLVTAVAYLAPEVALGRAPDPRSDLYSLGAMLYEMTAGRPPFLGDDALAVLAQHIHTPPVSPACHRVDLPAALEALILRLLAKVPGDRPPSAVAVRELLAAIVPGVPAGSSHRRNPLDELASGAFVGREGVLDVLRTAAEEAMAGRGCTVLLAGEAGIGKTRTAQAIATYARLREMAVVVGRCHEGEGAPAYWPWAQLLRQIDEPPGPEVAPLLAAPSTSPPEPSEARFRLLDGVARHLARAARTRPLLVVLDDLHWSDRASALLLGYVAREISDVPLLLVGTYRETELATGHPLASVLGEIAAVSRIVRLTGLDETAVARLMELTIGTPPDPALARALHERTGGNPLFVNEIVRLLTTSPGTLPSEIPAGVRAVIHRRIERLSTATRRMLATASVLGRELDVDVLERLCPGTDVSGCVDEAIAARLLDHAPDGRERLRFTHALVCECLYDDLGTAARAEHHRDAGDAITALRGADLTPHHPVLAHHFARAGDRLRAARHAACAAERAAEQLAFEDAAAHYERALAALGGDQLVERARLLLGLADMLLRSGERARARDVYRKAADLARRLDAADMLARAALGLAGRGEVTAGIDQHAVELLEVALRALPAGDGALRAQVLGRLAGALCFSDARERALALSQEALAMAERLADPMIVTHALGCRHVALWRPGNPEERLAIADRCVAVAATTGSHELARFAHLFRLIDLLELGDMRGVDVEMEHFARLAEAERELLHLWQLVSMRTMRAVLEGRFADAERLIDEGFALGQRIQSPNVLLRHAVHLFALRRAQGRLEELEPMIAGAVERLPALAGLRAALAALYAELGRTEQARVHFEQLAAGDFADLRRDSTWLGTMSELARACAHLRDGRRAVHLYELLLPHREHVVVITFAHGCEGAVARYLGLLAATLARWDEAATHFETALATNARLGAGPLLADTRREYAEMLLARGRGGDRVRATTLARAAASAYAALGLERHRERALALCNAGDAAPLPPPEPPNRFQRDGIAWALRYEGREARVRDGKGIRTLALLLASPERDVHVLELHAVLDGRAACAHPLGGSGEPVLDARARAELVTRLGELQAEHEEAERLHDLGRAERLRAEIEAIETHLASALGLGGRARRTGDPVERARKAVYNVIRASIAAIAAEHPTLGRHLAQSVRTGTFCCYRPERPTSWEVG